MSTYTINDQFTSWISKIDQTAIANIANINGVTWESNTPSPFNGVTDGSLSLSWDSAYQIRYDAFPTNAYDNKKWSWSCWFKRTGLPVSRQSLFYLGDTAGTGLGRGVCGFTTTSNWEWFTDSAGTAGYLITYAKLHDWRNWYHVHHDYDSSQATAADRMKMYINGQQVTEFSTENYPALDQAYQIDLNDRWAIGNSYARYASCNIADMYLTIGHNHAHTDVGEFAGSGSNIWIPKAYSQSTFMGSGTALTSEFTGWTNNTGASIEFDQTFTTSGFNITRAHNDVGRCNAYSNVSTTTMAVGDVVRVQCTLDIDQIGASDFEMYFGDGVNPPTATISDPGYNDGRAVWDATGTYTVDLYYVVDTADQFTIVINCAADCDINISGWTITHYANSAYKFGGGGGYWPFGGTDIIEATNGTLDRGWTNSNAADTVDAAYSITNLADSDLSLDHPEDNMPTIDRSNQYGASTQIQASTVRHDGGRFMGYATTNWVSAASSFVLTEGKWYVEYGSTTDVNYGSFGITTSLPEISTYINRGAFYPGDVNTPTNRHCGLLFGYNPGRLYQAGSYTSTTGYSFNTLGDKYGMAFNVDTGEVWFCLIDMSGSPDIYWFDSSGGITGDPAAGTNPTFTLTLEPGDTHMCPIFGAYQAYNHEAKFHEDDWDGTCPSGFNAIRSSTIQAKAAGMRVRDADIGDPRGTCVNSVVYTGSGAEQSITLGFQPDLVVIKSHQNTRDWRVFDSTRLATNWIRWNNTTAETTTAQSLKSFDSTGFTLGTDAGVNNSSERYSAYGWKTGEKYGFDIVSYTGDGTQTGRTISHSLNAVPTFIMIKAVDGAGGWYVYHRGASNTTDPETDHGRIDTTAAWADLSYPFDDTAPTSSVFSVGHDGTTNFYTNRDTYEYIAYLWTDIPGLQRAFYWDGSGSAYGPLAWTDFEPQIVIFKQTVHTNSMRLWDVADDRWPYNGAAIQYLLPDANNNETSDGYDAEIYSNGFKPVVATQYLNDNTDRVAGFAWGHRPNLWSPARMSDECDRV